MKKYLFLVALSCIFSVTAQVDINFASSNTQPERKGVIRFLLDAFELYHPGIRVNLLSYDENAGSDVIVQGENHLKPDLIMVDSVLFYHLLGHSDFDFEMTDRIVRTLGREDFYRGVLDSSCLDGQANCFVPYSAWLQVLWYRKDWFEEAGLPEPSDIASLLRAAQYFSEHSDSRYGIILGTKQTLYMQQCFLHLAGAMGFPYLSPSSDAFIPKGLLFDSLGTYTALRRSAPPGEYDWRARDYYFQNRAAMLLYSTHLMDDLVIADIASLSLTGENFEELEGGTYSGELRKNSGMITSLKGVQEASFGSVSGIGIFRSEDPAVRAAQEQLVLFLFRNDVYNTWLHMSPGGMLPVRRSVLQDDNFYRDPAGVFDQYGREQILQLAEGLEQLQVINPDYLAAGASHDRPEKFFLDFIYRAMKHPESLNQFVEQESWIR